MAREPEDRRDESWGNDRFVWCVALGAAVGVSLGTVFGAAFGSVGIGISVGVAVGPVLGILFSRMDLGRDGD
jgi:hypothetical protein